MKIFILEDEVDFYPRIQLRQVLEKKHELTIARSCDDAIEKFSGPYDLLLLDHDMEGNYEYRPEYPNTGYQFLKWLVENMETFFDGIDLPHVILHSHNPVGRKRMKGLLEGQGFVVAEHRFGPDYVKHLRETLG